MRSFPGHDPRFRRPFPETKSDAKVRAGRAGGRATQRARKGLTETEDDFATYFEGVLWAGGWRWVHFRKALDTRAKDDAGKPQWRTAVQGHKGSPDYMIVRRGRFMLIEIKGDSGSLDADQKAWRDDLIEASVEYHCFYPSDRAEIEALLLR